jgi:hypothetical protein
MGQTLAIVPKSDQRRKGDPTLIAVALSAVSRICKLEVERNGQAGSRTERWEERGAGPER